MNPLHPFVFAFSFVLVAAAVPAQTTTTASLPPILIDTVGPDGWRMRLGPTNLGSLLASEQGRELWQPRFEPLLLQWQNVVGDETVFAAARESVLGYGGRIRIGAWPVEGAPAGNPMRVAFVLESDGRTTMTSLAAEIRRMQDHVNGEWTKTEIGGATIELRTSGDDAMTAPIADGNHLLIAIGTKETIADALANARSLASDATDKLPPPTSPALRVRVDAATLVRASGASETLAKALGLDSLGDLTMAVATAGPKVQLEVAEAFTKDERGLFAALFPATTGVPELQRLRDDQGSWKVGRFDWKAAYLAIERAIESEEVGATDVRKNVNEELGIDVVDDLLAHVTDETLLSVGDVGDLEEVARTPWTLAVRTRDDAAFKKGMDAALAKANPMLSREASIEHEGGELRRYGNFLGYDVWVLFGHGLFAIAGGSECEERLKTMSTAAKSAKEKPPTEPLKNADFDALARYLPPGLNGVARGAVDSIVGIPLGAWLVGVGEAAPGLFPDVNDDPEARAKYVELLRKHELHTIRTASGFADRRWCWRLYW